jgi:hypothetical protein
VVGRHRLGKRKRFHIPNEIVDVVTAAVRRRQRIPAAGRRAVARLSGHYWQVRLYTPWGWMPTKE